MRLEGWDDLKGFGCVACKGHCIPSAALTGFFEKHSPGRVAELLSLARVARSSPRKLRCPDCKVQDYHLVRVDSLELDVCAGCGGLYCDTGEATRYLKGARKGHRGDTLVNIVDGANALEIIVEIICKIGH